VLGICGSLPSHSPTSLRFPSATASKKDLLIPRVSDEALSCRSRLDTAAAKVKRKKREKK
jgi:hypothetical protein